MLTLTGFCSIILATVLGAGSGGRIRVCCLFIVVCLLFSSFISTATIGIATILGLIHSNIFQSTIFAARAVLILVLFMMVSILAHSSLFHCCYCCCCCCWWHDALSIYSGLLALSLNPHRTFCATVGRILARDCYCLYCQARVTMHAVTFIY